MSILSDYHITPVPITDDNDIYDPNNKPLNSNLPIFNKKPILYYPSIRHYSFSQAPSSIQKDESKQVINQQQRQQQTSVQQTTQQPTQQSRNRSRRKKRVLHIPYKDNYIPTLDDIADSHDVNTELLAKIRYQFNNVRAIWLRSVMYDIYKDEYTYDDMCKCMYQCAYVMTSGPWRGAFIRLGYDPKNNTQNNNDDNNTYKMFTSNELLQWQVIDYRVPPDMWSLIHKYRSNSITQDTIINDTNTIDNNNDGYESDSDDDEEHEQDDDMNVDNNNITESMQQQQQQDNADKSLSQDTTLDIHFTQLPQRKNTLFQLCELNDNQIIDILKNAEISNECSYTTGYTTEIVYNNIRQRMKQLTREYMNSIGIDVSVLDSSNSTVLISQNVKQVRREHKKRAAQLKQQLIIQKQQQRMNKREQDKAERQRKQLEKQQQRKQKLLKRIEQDEQNVIHMYGANDIDNDNDNIDIDIDNELTNDDQLDDEQLQQVYNAADLVLKHHHYNNNNSTT